MAVFHRYWRKIAHREGILSFSNIALRLLHCLMKIFELVSDYLEFLGINGLRLNRAILYCGVGKRFYGNF